jgi:hypothetical protein
MNPQLPSLPDKDGVVGAVESRSDLRLCSIIDDAITLMRAAGTLPALEYLKLHAVDGKLILRVLLEPGKRRGMRLSAPVPAPA